MQNNKDYKITESQFDYRSENDLFGIELLTGEFSGIQYTYGTINFADEENADGTYSISFDYTIRKGKLEDEAVSRFENVVSDVLNSVLLDSLNYAHERYINETRNTNTETSDSE